MTSEEKNELIQQNEGKLDKLKSELNNAVNKHKNDNLINNEKIEGLQRELDELKQKSLKELEMTKKEKNELIQQKETEISELKKNQRKQDNNLYDKNNEIIDIKENMKNEINKLQIEINEIKQESLKKLKMSSDEKTNLINQKETEQDKLKSELKKATEQHKNDNINNEKIIKTKNNEISEFKEKQDNYENLLKNNKDQNLKELTSLKTDYDKMKNTLELKQEECNERILNYIKEKDDFNKILAKSENDNKEKYEKIINNIEQELNEVKYERDSLYKNLNEIKQLNNNLNNDIKTANEQIQQKQNQLNEQLINNNKKINEYEQKLINNNNELLSKTEKYEKYIKELNDKNEYISIKLLELQNNNDTLNNKYVGMQETYLSTHKNLENVNKQQIIAKDHLNKMDNMIKNKDIDNNKLMDELNKMKQECTNINAQNEKINELKINLTNIVNKNELLNIDNKKHYNMYEKEVEKTKNLINKIHELINEVHKTDKNHLNSNDRLKRLYDTLNIILYKNPDDIMKMHTSEIIYPQIEENVLSESFNQENFDIAMGKNKIQDEINKNNELLRKEGKNSNEQQNILNEKMKAILKDEEDRKRDDRQQSWRVRTIGSPDQRYPSSSSTSNDKLKQIDTESSGIVNIGSVEKEPISEEEIKLYETEIFGNKLEIPITQKLKIIPRIFSKEESIKSFLNFQKDNGIKNVKDVNLIKRIKKADADIKNYEINELKDYILYDKSPYIPTINELKIYQSEFKAQKNILIKLCRILGINHKSENPDKSNTIDKKDHILKKVINRLIKQEINAFDKKVIGELKVIANLYVSDKVEILKNKIIELRKKK